MFSVTDIKAKQAATASKTTFTVIERKVECPYNFQFYVDTGMTAHGPWVKIGINEKEYVAGFTAKRIEEDHGEDYEKSTEEEEAG